MRKQVRLFVLFVLLTGLLAVGVSAQDGPVRVAVILPSSTTDLAWSQSMFDALLDVQAQLGGEEAMEITFSDGMFDVTAATDAMRDYAEEGNDLIIAHGAQYVSSLLELAAEYPETSFAYSTASDLAVLDAPDNVYSYDVRAQEGGYVNGVMAGLLTESNVIGIVAPVPAADALLYVNGFTQGVAASNPEAEVLLAYTGSFGDTALAAETAQTQIAAGADILTGSAQQVPGAIDAIEEAGGLWFGSQTDQTPGWPETVAAVTAFDWSGILLDMIQNRAEGVLGGIDYEMSLADGGVNIVYNEETIPADVLAAGQAAELDVIAGRIYPVNTLPEETFRVAVVMPSSTTDLAWSQSIFTALQEMQAQLGGEDMMEIAFSEGVFDVTAAAEALRGYAEDGYDLVIAHGTQYGTSLFELAGDYPDTSFAWGTAEDTGEDQGLTNIFAYEARAEEGGYVNGVMAGLLTESNTVGIVGPVPAGDALLYINGFQQGVLASNPDAEILLAYTGSFGDTAAAAETAQTQIAAGADVLTGSAQQVVGAIDAIEGAGGFWFGTQSDQSVNWPETVVASQVFNWTPVIGQMIENNLTGTLGGEAYELSLTNGGLTFEFGEVDLPEEVIAAADAAILGVIAGDIVVEQELPEE